MSYIFAWVYLYVGMLLAVLWLSRPAALRGVVDKQRNRHGMAFILVGVTIGMSTFVLTWPLCLAYAAWEASRAAPRS